MNHNEQHWTTKTYGTHQWIEQPEVSINIGVCGFFMHSKIPDILSNSNFLSDILFFTFKKKLLYCGVIIWNAVLVYLLIQMERSIYILKLC